MSKGLIYRSGELLRRYYVYINRQYPNMNVIEKDKCGDITDMNNDHEIL